MVSTRELTGSKDQIVEQIKHVSGRILSAILVVDEPTTTPFTPPTQEEFAKIMTELESLAVHAPNVDYSREAMYTRMPGE